MRSLNVSAHPQFGDTTQANRTYLQAAGRGCQGSLLFSAISDGSALHLQQSDAIRGRNLSQICGRVSPPVRTLSLDDMLHDQLVCSIQDSRLQKRLLAEPELTFQKAFNLCQASEAADRNIKELQAEQRQGPKLAGASVMVVRRETPPLWESRLYSKACRSKAKAHG